MSSSGFNGGSGGHVEGTIPISGGDTVYVYVGGAGAGYRKHHLILKQVMVLEMVAWTFWCKIWI